MKKTILLLSLFNIVLAATSMDELVGKRLKEGCSELYRRYETKEIKSQLLRLENSMWLHRKAQCRISYWREVHHNENYCEMLENDIKERMDLLLQSEHKLSKKCLAQKEHDIRMIPPVDEATQELRQEQKEQLENLRTRLKDIFETNCGTNAKAGLDTDGKYCSRLRKAVKKWSQQEDDNRLDYSTTDK